MTIEEARKIAWAASHVISNNRPAVLAVRRELELAFPEFKWSIWDRIGTILVHTRICGR